MVKNLNYFSGSRGARGASLAVRAVAWILAIGAWVASAAGGPSAPSSGSSARAPAPEEARERVGKRPYELDWAGREQDAVLPLVDFESLEGWRAETRDAVASFSRTREEQIWGRYVGKLVYRGAGPNPRVRIAPPEPIPIAKPFDAVTLWVYGNNWGWAPDPSTPQVSVGVAFESKEGEFTVELDRVNWKEWHLLHRRLSPGEIEKVRDGARFVAILVAGGTNADDRTLYFDNLAVFVEQFPPLRFEPRPERGIPMFPGQGTGTNTGPGKLPFPTRPETILPANYTPGGTTSIEESSGAFVFRYRGPDGALSWKLEPKTGTLGDLTAAWDDRGPPFRPCVGGGIYLAGPGGPNAPERAEHLGTSREGDAVRSRWRLVAGDDAVEASFTYRLIEKSLVVEIVAPGGRVAEVRYGRAVGLERPRLVTNPYYLYSWGSARPAVIASGREDAPLFFAGNTDWCLSNASVLFAENAVGPDGVSYNGGTRYVPLADGRRNDCFERLFLTLSPRYEEVLPTIPNPPSPWKRVTGTKLWRAHGASDRERDAAHWRECHRYGMTEVVITDHETGWRDGGESFTFRTKAAPGKGGDEGQYRYARILQDELGFVYGPYNNFTDFAPVNEFWNFDLVSRTPENQLQRAWMRCYAPKPARAVEYCARLAPEIQRKFRFSTAYCDVHTAVAPWDRVDYDPRVPGAGTFVAVFYSFGEIMLLQKQAWGGPVYSEGTYHYLYCGLTDGNYGQDNPYRPWKNPWLVDFDLRKMHDLACNFGMGNLGMFYGDRPVGGSKDEMDALVDRFLAATVAFGHPGFLVYEGGLHNALRSYYMIQGLAARYCLESAADIRYADGAGRLLETSAAVASGAYERSQVVVRYSGGTIVAANGHPSERMKVEVEGRALDLPPNGYAGWTKDGTVEVLAADPEGWRTDYAETPAYIYIDGRGRFARFRAAASSGLAVCRRLGRGRHEIIPYQGAECGFALPPSKAVALDRERKPLGPAELRRSSGLTYVIPVPGAFSYLLEPIEGERAELRSERPRVVAGERVAVFSEAGGPPATLEIPRDAKPGARIWREIGGAWIDCTVVPFAEVVPSLEGDELLVRVVSHLPSAEEFSLRALGREARLWVEPEKPADLRIQLGPPAAEREETIDASLEGGGRGLSLKLRVRTAREHKKLAELPERWTSGIALRGRPETSDFGTTLAHVYASRERCGGVAKDALAMHPPYAGGVGYVFALFSGVRLPSSPPAAVRAEVGKGDGSDPGDGILFRLAVVEESGQESVVAETTVREHAWVPFEADLSRWAGRTVALKLIADVGPADNSIGDWARWASARVETLEPVLRRSLLGAEIEPR